MLCLFPSLLVFFFFGMWCDVKLCFHVAFFSLFFFCCCSPVLFLPLCGTMRLVSAPFFFFVCRMQPGLRHVCRSSVTRNHDLHDDDLLFFFYLDYTQHKNSNKKKNGDCLRLRTLMCELPLRNKEDTRFGSVQVKH